MNIWKCFNKISQFKPVHKLMVVLFVVLVNDAYAQSATGTYEDGNFRIREYGASFPIGVGTAANEISPPLLNSFWFGYTKHNTDHEFFSVHVMPGGESIDLSPTAQAGHFQIEKGKIGLSFGDSGLDDKYKYEIRHSRVMFAPSARFQIRDVGCTGSCSRQLENIPDNAEFVLVGFNLHFTGNRDHDLDQFAIYEEDGILHVVLNDKNNDDVFGYKLDYTWVSRDMTLVSVKEEEGTITTNGGAQLPLDDTDAYRVISGFEFDYISDDHEVKDLGVLLKDNKLMVLYGDKNGDSDAKWRVKWLELHRKNPVNKNTKQ